MALEVITLAEAAKLSNNKLVQGVIEDVVSNNAWYQYLPFVMFEGLSYTFIREKELAKVAFATPGANLNAAKYQKGATFQNVNVNLASIIGDIIINGHIQDQLSETNGQLAAQISSKAKAMGRMYMNAIINGKRGNALTQSNNGYIGIEQGFDGMKRILDAEQGNVDDVHHPFFNAGNPTQTKELVELDPASPRFGLKGAAFSLEDLDDLIARVTAGECHFLMMHTRDINTLKTLMRNTGHGVNSITVQEPGLGTKKPMLYYDGIPVFRNDYVSVTEGVNPVASGTIASVGATTITTDFDNTSVAIAAAPTGYIVEVRDDSGLLRKYPILAATAANPMVLTVQVTGQFLDVENGEMVDHAAPNASGLGLAGKTYTVYERADGSEIYAGRFGEMEGVCGFGLLGDKMGWGLVEVGPRENEDAHQLRLRWRVGFDLYKRLSLARLKYVLPLGA